MAHFSQLDARQDALERILLTQTSYLKSKDDAPDMHQDINVPRSGLRRIAAYVSTSIQTLILDIINRLETH